MSIYVIIRGRMLRPYRGNRQLGGPINDQRVLTTPPELLKEAWFLNSHPKKAQVDPVRGIGSRP